MGPVPNLNHPGNDQLKQPPNGIRNSVRAPPMSVCICHCSQKGLEALRSRARKQVCSGWEIGERHWTWGRRTKVWGERHPLSTPLSQWWRWWLHQCDLRKLYIYNNIYSFIFSYIYIIIIWEIPKMLESKEWAGSRNTEWAPRNECHSPHSHPFLPAVLEPTSQKGRGTDKIPREGGWGSFCGSRDWMAMAKTKTNKSYGDKDKDNNGNHNNNNNINNIDKKIDNSDMQPLKNHINTHIERKQKMFPENREGYS